MEVLHERPSSGPGFLSLRRIEACAAYPAGGTSEPFVYDVVLRSAMDAVVMAATFREGGVVYVLLRSAVRTPLALRDPGMASLWELPAGLVEQGEEPREAATRELLEELGARVDPEALRTLGPPTAPAPGMVAEVQHFFHAEIEQGALQAPTEDGSPLERNARIVALPLDGALEELGRHGLVDAKTELGLRRLVEALA